MQTGGFSEEVSKLRWTEASTVRTDLPPAPKAEPRAVTSLRPTLLYLAGHLHVGGAC